MLSNEARDKIIDDLMRARPLGPNHPRQKSTYDKEKPGDRWCLCALRWKQAYDNGMAPPVFLDSTHIETLKFIDLNILKQFTLN